METFIVSAYFEKSLSEVEASKISTIISNFANQITGIPESEYNKTIKKGSWEIIIDFIIPATTWTLDKIGSYLIKKKMDNIFSKNINPETNIRKESSVLEPSNQNDAVATNRTKTSTIDLSKAFEAVGSIVNVHKVNRVSFGKCDEEGNGQLMVVTPGDNGKININFIETANFEQFDKLISKI